MSVKYETGLAAEKMFSQASGLERNRFYFDCLGASQYYALMAQPTPDGKYVQLGEVYDNVLNYVEGPKDTRNEHFQGDQGVGRTARSAALQKFFGLCAEKHANASVNVPTLYGNPEFWDDVYRNAAKLPANYPRVGGGGETGIKAPVWTP